MHSWPCQNVACSFSWLQVSVSLLFEHCRSKFVRVQPVKVNMMAVMEIPVGDAREYLQHPLACLTSRQISCDITSCEQHPLVTTGQLVVIAAWIYTRVLMWEEIPNLCISLRSDDTLDILLPHWNLCNVSWWLHGSIFSHASSSVDVMGTIWVWEFQRSWKEASLRFIICTRRLTGTLDWEPPPSTEVTGHYNKTATIGFPGPRPQLHQSQSLSTINIFQHLQLWLIRPEAL